MSDQNDTPSLAELSERIKDAEDAHKQPKHEAPPPSPMRVGVELLSGVVVGGLMGFWADYYLGTKPLLLVVFTIFGFAGGFWNIYREANKPIPPVDPKNNKSV